jgi:hypothetical protein
MAIKQIFIANILECYYKNYQSLPEKERNFWTLYDSLEGNRALLYGSDNKVVITYQPIDADYLHDFSALMKWRNVDNYYPKQSSYSTCHDCVNDRELNRKLIEVIKENPGVNLIPYRATHEFQELISYLKKRKLNFATPETIPADKQFIISYFNTKRGFRHIWHKVNPKTLKGINIPEGFIVSDRTETIEAAWWFKAHHKSFVIKYNKGVQGIGVVICDQQKFSTDKEKFSKQINGLLKDKLWDEPIIVVEEAIKINNQILSGSPNVEFFIDTQGHVNKAYCCQQILAADKKTFCGVYIYPELIKNKLIKKAFAAGLRIGRELSAFGYRGYFDMDLVTGEDGNIYAVETNLRRTGGTHLHESMNYLLGKNYFKRYHVINEDIHLSTDIKFTYQKILKMFSKILYDPKKIYGLIIVNPDMLKVNIFNVTLVAKSHDEIFKLRNEVLKKLNNKLA